MESLELRKHTCNLNYPSDIEKITKFILFYSESNSPKYLPQLRNKVIDICIEDVLLFDDTGLYSRIRENTITYLNLFYSAIDAILFNSDEYFFEENLDDLFFYHRLARLKEKFPEKKITEVFPTALLRKYFIFFISEKTHVLPIRSVKSTALGRLITVRGVVTRVTQVKPNIQVSTYICDNCGVEVYQTVNNDTFDLLKECTSNKCKTRSVKNSLHLQTSGSKFIKFQSIKLQELTTDVPKGSVPISLNVECYEKVDMCKPGDCIEITGTFLPRPFYGFKKINAGLLSDTFFYAMDFKNESGLSEDEIIGEVEVCSIESMVEAIAPEIYGKFDVKKILLLMLVGAPTITRRDGFKIRGDINVLLLGDPGIAKSQLLKTITKICRRGIYTSGKGTSGVGLTASVVKDPTTNELVLEGGALVLSDTGICCIDELDKMNEYDRSSIYEVMEQQSISISKAGINTTLNARCSILAAANPIKGRYNVKRSVEYNVGLPIALISRFDVVVVLRDEPDINEDYRLANHITHVHTGESLSYEEEKEDSMSYAKLRGFIEKAKTFSPKLTDQASKRISDSYIDKRRSNPLTTPRYLLSIIRLCLAHCRLRFSAEVNDLDVDEAIRLMKLNENIDVSEPTNPKYSIYNLILSMKRNDKVNISDIYERLGSKFKKQDISECLEEFEKLGVWVINDNEVVILN